MAQFEILDDAGQVANVVVASAEFVDQRYPGRYREIVDLPAQGQQVTPADVDAERDRRIDAGFLFNGIQFQSRAGDRESIAGKAMLAFMAITAGAQPGDLRWAKLGSDFVWIATDNSLVPMDAQTMVDFGKAAADHKEAHVFAGYQLKQMIPVPVDFTDDKWWP